MKPKEVLPNSMKRCTVCNEVKAVSEYGISSKSKDGLRGQCKACRHKEYLDNKEVRNRQARENYLKNRESILAKQKADRERSVENKRQKDKRYYQKNRAKIIQKNKEY